MPATALVATVADPRAFTNGRHLGGLAGPRLSAALRTLKQQRWCVHQRVVTTPGLRFWGWVRRAGRSNGRWAMEVTHTAYGQDSWAHLAGSDRLS